jgi:hypothetical protein
LTMCKSILAHERHTGISIEVYTSATLFSSANWQSAKVF